MAFGQYDGSIRIDTSLNTSNFNSALGKITQSVKKFGATVGVAFGVNALIKFGKEALNIASDIQEVQNVVDTAFGSMSGMVESFASTAIEKFGMSELAAKQTASIYMAMSKDMGMYGEQAAKMAIDAAARTGDIASFYNMTQKEADTMFKSIWTGETESLKRIGVVMTQTNLDQYALQKGLGKTTSAMNQQELTLLRYQYVMDKTNLAAGDFEKTQDSWANQTRVLTERWKQFLGLMGSGLIQMLTPAVKFLNNVMSLLMKFAEAFSKVTAALFGKQTLNTVVSTTTATEDVASATDDYAASVEKAKKKQDKFLAGVDEITTLNEQNGDSTSSAANSSFGGVSVPAISGEIGGDVTISPALQGVINTLTRFFDKIKQIDLTPAKESLSRLWEALKPFGETIGEGLAWFWDNVLIPLGQWVIEDAVPAFLDLLTGAIRALTPAIDAAKEGFKWLWDEFLKPIAEWTGGVIVSVLEKLAEKLTELGNWLTEHKEGVEDFVLILTSFAIAWAVVTAAVNLWNSISAIATAVTTAFGTAVSFLTSPIGLVILAIGALIAIVVLCVKHWDEIKEAASKAWEWIKSVWNTASAWVNDKVIVPIANFFSGLWDGIKNTFTTAFEFIKTAFKNYVNGWISIVERFINFFVGAINLLVRGLNKISFDIPEWVPSIGGRTFGFNIKEVPKVYIPRLATGAVIPPNAEFAAILGDQKHGRNLEAPESLLRQIAREEAGANLTVILQMPNGEEKKVFDTKAIKKANRQSGKILIPIEV